MSDTKTLGRITMDELKVLFGTSLNEEALAPFSGKALAKAFVLEGPVQARLVEQILEQESIPFLIQSHRDTAYDGIFTPSLGWGVVITVEEDGPRARGIIEAVLEAGYDGEENDE